MVYLHMYTILHTYLYYGKLHGNENEKTRSVSAWINFTMLGGG